MYKGERFNSISHLLAGQFALAGGSVLITMAVVDGGITKIVSYSVYSATLVLMYLSSVLFHAVKGAAKDILQKIDHFAIYLLIAGTYTPFALVAIKGAEGWWLFGIIWTLAAIGILFDSLKTSGPRIIPIVIYLMMGWCCVFSMNSIIAALTPLAFDFLLIGGIIYTLGIVFFILDNWYPWCHGIWHLFVIMGSASHYFAIFLL